MKTFKGKNNEVLGTFLENTDVVVNPTLVGDEPEMTGIQVGGQKYKAPQGGGSGGSQLYLHNIQISNAKMYNTYVVPMTTAIISQSSTPMTTATLISWLKQNNFTIDDQVPYDGTQKYYNVNGIASIEKNYIAFAVGIVCYIDNDYGEEYIGMLEVEPVGASHDVMFRPSSGSEVTIDTVIAL